MLIYKIKFSLLTLFIFMWAWPKGACRMQTEVQTDDLCLLRQRIGEQS